VNQPNRWSQFEDDEVIKLHAAACVAVIKIRSRNLTRLAYEMQDEILRRNRLDDEIGTFDDALRKMQ
jgi:hypothetical protein